MVCILTKYSMKPMAPKYHKNLSPIGLIKDRSCRGSRSIGGEKNDESQHHCALRRICPNEGWRILVKDAPHASSDMPE
ncbi:hypothetical protein MJO28_012135 [Puccinia striiformis f. sp. tritici]|uniref:Uncharacterized protein n=1 Tax=Puccinia striiformis f. sp. tritici TaxID=168172 RepID=A0ACC0E215_9BASI|nr:hypothetical protein MJO28_012135 [Puccinia striiformis f. sp. tritici]